MPSRHSHRRRGVKKRTVEQRVNAKRATAHLHVPDRGEVDAHTGETWEGFDRMKIKSLTLTQAEQATNSTDERVLASGDTNAERAVDGNHIKTGSIGDTHINGRLGTGVLPEGMVVGKVNSRGGITYQKKSIPMTALKGKAPGSGSISGIKQSISGINNKIKNLSNRVQKLEQGKKKN